MTGRKKLTEEEVRRAAEGYAETKNLASIARQFGVTPATLRRSLAEVGVETSGSVKNIDLTREALWERYKVTPIKDLAIELGLSTMTLAAKLEAAGIYYAPADREDIGQMVTGLIEQLATRREALGWTRKQVGAACSVAAPQIGKWELGNYYPRLPFLVEWGAALGLDLVPADDHGLRWVEREQNEEARADFLVALYRSGKTSREVAQIAGVTQPTLIRLLKRHGVEMRKRGARPRSIEPKIDEAALAALMGRVEEEIRRIGELPKVRLVLGKKSMAVISPDEG